MNPDKNKLSSEWYSLMREGHDAHDRGLYTQAITHYNDAINILRINNLAADIVHWYQLYEGRGLAHYKIREYENVLSDFNECIRMLPEGNPAYYHRGLCPKEKGNQDLAINDFTKSLKINPDDAYAYNERGIAYVQKGQLDIGISDFTKALSIDSEHTSARKNLQKAKILKKISKGEDLTEEIEPMLREANGYLHKIRNLPAIIRETLDTRELSMKAIYIAMDILDMVGISRNRVSIGLEDNFLSLPPNILWRKAREIVHNVECQCKENGFINEEKIIEIRRKRLERKMYEVH